jgi:hypothetical protein
MNFDESDVSWTRVAEPQEDQYDSFVAIELARRQGYVSAPIGEALTAFDGKVAIRNDITFLDPNCVPAEHNHHNIEKACALIRFWPSAFTQMQLLVESISVFMDTRFDMYENSIGSISCHGDKGFGWIAATVNTAEGLAQAMVHEMAHNKLLALGVGLESAERIILNPPDERFKSPIRYDCLRPMPAVIHAQYSFTYVAALCIEIIKAARNKEMSYLIAERALATKLPKLEFGLEVIEKNVKIDQAGAGFIEGLFRWLGRVFDDGHHILNEFQILPQAFTHPLNSA